MGAYRKSGSAQIHWVNPLIWRLTKGDQEWQRGTLRQRMCKDAADRKTSTASLLRKYRSGRNEYADLLVNPVQMFHDTKNLTMERIERMQRYPKESKMKKSAVAAVLTGVLLVGSTSVFAATSGIAAVQEAVFWGIRLSMSSRSIHPGRIIWRKKNFGKRILIQAGYTIESAESTGDCHVCFRHI